MPARSEFDVLDCECQTLPMLSGLQHALDGAVVHPQVCGDSVQRVTILVGDQDGLNGFDRLAGGLGGDQIGGHSRGRVGVRRLRGEGRGYGGSTSRADTYRGRVGWRGSGRGRSRGAGASCRFVTDGDQAIVETATARSITIGMIAARAGGVPASTARSRSATKLITNAPPARAAVAATAVR